MSPQSHLSDPFLIVGTGSLIGARLMNYWYEAGNKVIGTSLRPSSNPGHHLLLDLAQPAESWPELPRCRAAILCAAKTSLLECRTNPVATRFVNVRQTLNLAEKLVDNETFVVFLSNNLVFDGRSPLRESTEIPSPRTEYGRQKAEAEVEFTRLANRAAIVRLTKVFHPGMILIRGWIDYMRAGRPITPYADLVCAPISLDAVVRIVATIAERALPGIWQISAAADISYSGIAGRLAQIGGFDPSLVQSVAMPAAEAVNVPRYSTLDSSRARVELGFDAPDPLTVIDQTFFNND